MVMPILCLLMFQLGLDFEALRKVAWILGRLFWTSSPPSLPHKETIIREFPRLGLCIGLMIIIAIVAGGILSRLAGLSGPDRKTIIIEVGMQNAAQAIAVACSPFIFANEVIAIPAIIYALLMNIVLLVYVWMVRLNKF